MIKIFLKKKWLNYDASDLGLHCLPITRLWVTSLQWVNLINKFSVMLQ